MADEDTPTQSDLAAGQDVALAGAAAAAAEPEAAKKRPAARRAIKQTAQEKGWELSDEDCGRIADLVVDRIGERGGFDHPLEPITAPAPVAAQPPAPETPPEPPAKRTFAERFRSHQ